jgi:hypothetical protein
MLDIDARNGGLPLIGRLTSWLVVPLVVGGLTALPAASVPVGMIPASHRSSMDCSTRAACLSDMGGTAVKRVAAALDVGYPGAPTRVAAIATDGQAEVSWSAPRTEGSPRVSSYVVTSSPPTGPVVVSGGQTSASIGGLANGEQFTFTVAATSSSGQGPQSLPSNGVTPEALSVLTSTVSMRGMNVMFNGGICLNQGTQCFGIQQNSFIHAVDGAEYWVQNLVFVEDSPQRGWGAAGAYEIWSGNQQSVIVCSGIVSSGPHGEYCDWALTWHKIRFPTQFTLTSSVGNGDVQIKNSLGDLFPAWTPGPGGVQYIVDLHEAAVPSLLSLYAPETVLVGETGRHNVTFIGGSGSIRSQMVLTNGQNVGLGTRCVAQSSDTSTGESSVGFYWTAGGQRDGSTVDFMAHGGLPGNGDGVKTLPGSQACV